MKIKTLLLTQLLTSVLALAYNYDSDDGISGLQMGSSYQVQGSKSYIVKINTNPTGATVQVDGISSNQCPGTPCKIQLKEGTHSFSLKRKDYVDSDTTVDINQSGTSLNINLTPNFGHLNLAPKLTDNIGNPSQFRVTIDGNSNYKISEIALWTGVHNVQLNHPCYEPVSFDVTIKPGSKILFDRELIPSMGGLDLQAVKNGKPQEEPVYINGNMAGTTPFLEAVPVCSSIAIGENKIKIPVKIIPNKNVQYTMDMEFYEFTDERDNNTYKTATIGKQIWMTSNLRFEGNGKCVPGDDNCKKNGRIYSWSDALCPAGYQLPSQKDYEYLIKQINEKGLKREYGWPFSGNFWTGDKNGPRATAMSFESGITSARFEEVLATKSYSIRCIRSGTEIKETRDSKKNDEKKAQGSGRSKDDIMKVVKRRTPELKTIYNSYLKSRRGFSGIVTLKFTIVADGTITNISIAKSTTNYAEFDEVIKKAVSKWTFPPIDGMSTTVTLPWTFTK